MATFEKGDRVVKMSGVNAGKYGTVNSISESGTLNVTFDGERLSRFCDPDRCGKVAANAKFKVGDKVVIKEWKRRKTAGFGKGTIIGIRGGQFLVRPDKQSFEKYYVPTYAWNENDLIPANSRTCNATGDQVIAMSGKYKLVYNPLNEGYWFYVGDYGEGMSDANGRSIFGKDKKSVAMAEFKRLVATANSRAANAVARNNFTGEFKDARFYLGEAIEQAKIAYGAIANPFRTYTPESKREKAAIQGGMKIVQDAVRTLEDARKYVDKLV